MPRKMVRSAPRPPFGLPDAAGGTLTSRLPCSKARNTGTFTPDRESSGESRNKSVRSVVARSNRWYFLHGVSRMLSKTKILLADLAHTYSAGNSALTMPLGIGYVKAFATDALTDTVDIRLFKHPERFLQAVEDTKPDIVGFANYGWNQNLNREIGRRVRTMLPRATIVAGGPNLDPSPLRRTLFLETHGYVDFLVVDGGEEPFTELVKWARETHKDYENLPSNIVWRDGDKIRQTKERPLKKIIDHLPSPYLGGHLDEFLVDGLIPLFETNRGCPFRCTFCAWGSASKDLVRRIDMDQAIAEILYVGERSRARHWIICDANFGILPRDVEIAKAIRAQKDRHGHPHTCDIWLAKNTTDRCLEVGKILGDMAVPVMAVQSLADDVLRHIKRDNIKTETYEKYQQQFHQIGSKTYSDLIVPLPGETVSTHLDAVRSLMKMGVDIIANHNMRLLAGAETNSDETRREFSFATKYRLIHGDAGAYTAPDGSAIRSFEYEESLRSTSDISEAEMFWLRKIHFMIDFSWNIEVYRPLLNHCLKMSVSPLDVLIKAMLHDGLKAFFDDFESASVSEWHDSAELIEKYFADDANFQRLVNGEFEKLNIQFSVIALQRYKRAFDLAIKQAVADFNIDQYERVADYTFDLFPPLDQAPSAGFVETPARRLLRDIIISSNEKRMTLSKTLNTNGISLSELKVAPEFEHGYRAL